MKVSLLHLPFCHMWPTSVSFLSQSHAIVKCPLNAHFRIGPEVAGHLGFHLFCEYYKFRHSNLFTLFLQFSSNPNHSTYHYLSLSLRCVGAEVWRKVTLQMLVTLVLGTTGWATRPHMIVAFTELVFSKQSVLQRINVSSSRRLWQCRTCGRTLIWRLRYHSFMLFYKVTQDQ